MIGPRRVRLKLLEKRLTYGLGMRREEQELYGLLDNPRGSSSFVSYRDFTRRIRPALNGAESGVLLDNKWVFYQLARAFGIAIPDTWALFDSEFGITIEGLPCRRTADLLALIDRVRPKGLVIKPAGGLQGKGLVILDDIDYTLGIAILPNGETVDLEQRIKSLPPVRLTGVGGYVVQELVEQHSFFSDLNPHTPNTVRVVTHLTQEGELLVPFAVVRLGREGNVADNWAQGGLSIGVDPETGRMSRGLVRPKYGGEWFTAHPDTKVGFTGRLVPMWDQVLALCSRAARMLPGLRSVGWDVLISQDEPVILEANDEWDLIMVQVHTDGWLSLPGMRDDLSKLGVKLPNRLPSWPTIVGGIVGRRLVSLGHGWRVRD